MSDNPQPPRVVEQLYVAHICGGYFNTSVENLAEQLRNSSGLDQPRAQLLHPGHRREVLRQPLVELSDGFFGPFLFRDIASDLRRADDLPTVIPERRYGQRNVEERSVLAQAYSLEMIHALAALQALKDLPLFVAPVRGNHDENGFSDRFGGRIAVETLRRRDSSS